MNPRCLPVRRSRRGTAAVVEAKKLYAIGEISKTELRQLKAADKAR